MKNDSKKWKILGENKHSEQTGKSYKHLVGENLDPNPKPRPHSLSQLQYLLKGDSIVDEDCDIRLQNKMTDFFEVVWKIPILQHFFFLMGV